MRRKLLIVGILSVGTAGLIACSSGDSTSETQATETPGTTSADSDETDGDDEGRVGVPLTLSNDSTLTIHTADPNAEGDLARPDEGDRFYVFDIEQCAGDSEVEYTALDWAVKSADNREYDSTIEVDKPFQPSFTGGTLPPGECIRGFLVFEVPTAAQATLLRYNSMLNPTKADFVLE